MSRTMRWREETLTTDGMVVNKSVIIKPKLTESPLRDSQNF